MNVYFVQQGDDGPIKVGVTNNVNKRICGLQVSSPNKLKILHVLEITDEYDKLKKAKEIESFFHSEFKAHKMNGEWFKPVPFVLGSIRQIKEKGMNNLFSHRDEEMKVLDQCYEDLYRLGMRMSQYGDFYFIDHLLSEIIELHRSVRSHKAESMK